MATAPIPAPNEGEDDVPFVGERNDLRLWFAELAIELYSHYRGADEDHDLARTWASEDAEDIYRMILGMSEDIDDPKNKPDPKCVQSKLPRRGRASRKQVKAAVQT